MISGKRVLALISARGGSKGLPGKNIRCLAGKPLIVYSIEAALQAENIDRVVVSTDSQEIADVARQSGAEVPFMRPSELARDDTPSLPVSQHAVAWLREHEGWSCDILAELPPVAPLRTIHDIEAALSMLTESGADSVISLCAVEGAYHPYWMKRIDNDRVIPLMNLPREYTRRQDLPPVYRRNGALIAVWTHVLMEKNSYYGDEIRGYLMPEARSIDIDNELDFAVAEVLMGQGCYEA